VEQRLRRSVEVQADSLLNAAEIVLRRLKDRHLLPSDFAPAVDVEVITTVHHTLRLSVTGLKGRKNEAPLKILDAAYWIKGCSSLGGLRYAVLLGVGKLKANEFCLIDIKEAVAATAPRYEKTTMPRDNAKRVVEGARNLSPYLGERMLAARFMGKAVIVRELLPQDLKLERIDEKEAVATANFLAAVVGKAHGRQLDPTAKKEWLSDLSLCRSKNLDAPSWLWNSIVELVSIHEAAYLQHCRALNGLAKANRQL
jgi:uncharacterized protein (DUF2252 family)